MHAKEVILCILSVLVPNKYILVWDFSLTSHYDKDLRVVKFIMYQVIVSCFNVDGFIKLQRTATRVQSGSLWDLIVMQDYSGYNLSCKHL